MEITSIVVLRMLCNIMKNKAQILLILIFLALSCQESRTSESANNEINSIADSFHLTSAFNDCYVTRLKLNITDSIFTDTTFDLRDYLTNDNSKRIVCNKNYIDLQIEKLILESDYLQAYRELVDRLDTNKFAVLEYDKINDSNIVANFYISDKIDLKTVKMRSFLISEGEIIGINILPGIVKYFVPINEFNEENFEVL